MTADPERAFLTTDSGFPLTALEEALAKGTTFTYAFPSSRVPVLFSENEWRAISSAKSRGAQSLVDILLHEPAVDRLYWALANSDAQTRNALAHSPGLARLLPYGPVLDFYGTQICIRGRRVVVPGGPSAEAGWRELAGASPRSPGDFVLGLAGMRGPTGSDRARGREQHRVLGTAISGSPRPPPRTGPGQMSYTSP